jgi:hypothetical protein
MLRSLRFFLPVPMLVLAAACTSSSANFRGEIARTDPARIHVCHGFDCHYTTRLDLTDADRQKFARIMNSGRADPARERAAISLAVQHFEERSTEVIGVRDAPRSHIGQSGQTGAAHRLLARLMAQSPGFNPLYGPRARHALESLR